MTMNCNTGLKYFTSISMSESDTSKSSTSALSSTTEIDEISNNDFINHNPHKRMYNNATDIVSTNKSVGMTICTESIDEDDIVIIPVIKKSRCKISTVLKNITTPILQLYTASKNDGPSSNIRGDIMSWIENIHMSLTAFHTNNKFDIQIGNNTVIFSYVKLIQNIHFNNYDMVKLFLKTLVVKCICAICPHAPLQELNPLIDTYVCARFGIKKSKYYKEYKEGQFAYHRFMSKNSSLKNTDIECFEYNRCIDNIVQEMKNLKLDTNNNIILYSDYEKKYDLIYDISTINIDEDSTHKNSIGMYYKKCHKKETVIKRVVFNQSVVKKFTTNIDEIIDSNIYRFLGCVSLTKDIVATT